MKIIVLLISLTCIGCNNAQNFDRNITSKHPIKTSSDGIKYKIFEIEGKKFIGTQDARGAWSFAGPI